MMSGRTFGTKLAGAFGLTVSLTLLMGAASVAALAVAVGTKDAVVSSATEGLSGAQQLNTTMVQRLADFRAYMLNGRQDYLDATEADPEAGRLFLAAAAHLHEWWKPVPFEDDPILPSWISRHPS